MGKVTQFVTNVVNWRSEENVLSWWTLRFMDRDLETLFNAENDKGIWRKRMEMAFFTFACCLGTLYMLGTSWSTLSGGHKAFYFILAVVGTTPSVLFHYPRFQRHHQLIFTVFIFFVAVLLIVLATNVLDAPSQSRDFQSGFAALLLFLLFSVVRVTYYLALLCGILVWFVELIVVSALFLQCLSLVQNSRIHFRHCECDFDGSLCWVFYGVKASIGFAAQANFGGRVGAPATVPK